CRFLFMCRRIIRSLDILVISGGGQLTEKDGPWGFPYTIFKWILLARSVGVRCIFLNVGAGPLTSRLGSFFARQALQRSEYVSFRDDESRQLAYKIGFSSESWVCPDCAYGLEIETTTGDKRRGSQAVVGFAPMPYPDVDPRGYRADDAMIIYQAL